MGLITFPDGVLDVLDSTHIHSFPFVVMMGLQVAASLARFEIEDMTLDHMSIPLDFDFPVSLTGEGGLIFVLREKQPCFIAGAAIGAMLCPFSSRAEKSLIGGSFHRSWSLWRFFCQASSSLMMVSCIRWGV